MAPLEKGCMAELDSAVASDLAMGASGRVVRAAKSLEDPEATNLAVVGESFAGCLGCSAVGSHIRRSAAESSKDHLSMAAAGKDAEGCNRESLAVPEYRCHWPIGHVLNSTLGRDQDDSFKATPPCFLEVVDFTGDEPVSFVSDLEVVKRRIYGKAILRSRALRSSYGEVLEAAADGGGWRRQNSLELGCTGSPGASSIRTATDGAQRTLMRGEAEDRALAFRRPAGMAKAMRLR
jgi:hypothetical protein